MKNEQEILSWLKQKEEENQDKSYPSGKPNFRLESTKNYPGLKKIKNPQPIKIEPFSLRPDLIFLLISLVIIFWVISTRNFELDNPFFLAFIGLLVSVYFVIRHRLAFEISEKYVFIGQKGIRLDQNQFYWSEIVLTAILTQSDGKKETKCLVIVDRSLKVTRYNLKGLYSFTSREIDAKIASQIEAFKEN